MPLPERLAALLVEVTEQLTAADTPLAALRAAGVLDRIAARVGRETAGPLCDDGMSAEAVATELGTFRAADGRDHRRAVEQGRRSPRSGRTTVTTANSCPGAAGPSAST
ncbi:hypothetical protein [Streptomyces virginiae]|uniref:hypothetical protein n=1 Tax=Streptomyces virginiae TaxID=1961 RepID=UPI00386B5AB7|nr:hypothetical protein OG253_00780 [Streptomyces virginiae]